MTYREKYPQVFDDLEEMSGLKIITLTPDDILTLKLLRDSWLPMATIDTKRWAPLLEKIQINETLERILKQIQ